jgi:hypothetical protein
MGRNTFFIVIAFINSRESSYPQSSKLDHTCAAKIVDVGSHPATICTRGEKRKSE